VFDQVGRGRSLVGQLLFLGTGTSHGVPVIGCRCDTCGSSLPENRRTRCSVLLGLPGGHLLVDTPPDLHVQMLRERIGMVHAIAYTHAHADHLFGLDDVRIFSQYLGRELPVYCTAPVEARIRQAFDYVFAAGVQKGGGLPQLRFERIDAEPFEVLGARITPIPLWHGRMPVLGFRIGNVAYCTDTNNIPPESMRLLAGLDVLVIDALRHNPHPTHFNLTQALEIIAALAPRRALLTHICHDLEPAQTGGQLPPGVEMAFDGLTIPVSY